MQHFTWIGNLGDGISDLDNELADFLFKEGEEDVVFVVEVKIDGAIRNIGFFGDVGDPGIKKAFLTENLDGGIKDFLVFISLLHCVGMAYLVFIGGPDKMNFHSFL